MQTDKIRKKKWAPKTFNGCLTCKKRRVKCDEGKPFCKRCLKSKIRCGGYAPPKVRLFEPSLPSSSSSANASAPASAPLAAFSSAINDPTTSENLQLQSCCSSYLHPLKFSVHPSFGTEDEYRVFRFFLTKTSDLISAYSQPYLWTVILPQVTWYHPAIKHSILAIASLHQALTTPGAAVASTTFMLHYNKAIHALTVGKPPIDVVLTTCIMFWALENINGGGKAAFEHMKAAVKILWEWKAKRRPGDPAHGLISGYLEPAIMDGLKIASPEGVKELEAQLSSLSLSTQNTLLMNSDIPAFDSLDMAAEELGDCIRQILSLLSTLPRPDAVEATWEIDTMLYKWVNLFQSLSSTGPTWQRMMLLVHNIATYILLDQLKTQVSFPTKQSSEPPRSRHSYVVLELEDVLQHDDPATLQSWSKCPPPGMGLIPPLFLAASSAPELETRGRAVKMLRLLHLTEGPWNSDMAAMIAETMLDIVHQFSIRPTEVELRHMRFDVDMTGRVLYMRWEPQSEQLQAVAFFRKIDVILTGAGDGALVALIQNFGYRFDSP